MITLRIQVGRQDNLANLFNNNKNLSGQVIDKMTITSVCVLYACAYWQSMGICV